MENKEIMMIQQPIGGLSVIEDVDINKMQTGIAKIKNFQSLIQSQFVKNDDYGVIPGTGTKPALLKPGADKITMLLGLNTEYEIMDSTRDFKDGFFQYQIKCKMFKNNICVIEGLGSCNTKERKYIKQDPFTLDNTVLKMAKKRALVDAALSVGNLSNVFTQDIEDMDIQGNKPQKRQYFTDNDGTISQAQAKRLFAIAKGNSDIIKDVMKKYNYNNSADIKKTDYEKIAQEIEININDLEDFENEEK